MSSCDKNAGASNNQTKVLDAVTNQETFVFEAEEHSQDHNERREEDTILNRVTSDAMLPPKPPTNEMNTAAAADEGSHKKLPSLKVAAVSIETISHPLDGTADMTSSSQSPTTHAPMPHLSHVASEPVFGFHMRRSHKRRSHRRAVIDDINKRQQQLDAEIANEVKDAERTSSSSAVDGGDQSQCESATASPKMTRKSSDGSLINNFPRRVSFPKSDSELVTGYLEPANPWEHGSNMR